jgi:hypothetical protein
MAEYRARHYVRTGRPKKIRFTWEGCGRHAGGMRNHRQRPCSVARSIPEKFVRGVLNILRRVVLE